ncbi:Tyrosine-protein kinase YwqD [Planctomycetes bacterium Pan216]|uniref:non-specific protein-tyrosine kinase n=1 Tax=Kolteria novifilia TaxID=2527975 RepID=A0A518BBX8_9BACT|nr:Tyrosine-protein kinase YwqD [Planctomycetes bacterium Pan216]
MDRQEPFDPNASDDSPIIAMPDLTRLVQIVWERRWTFLVGPVVFLALATLYYVQATPRFESEAKVLVINKKPTLMTDRAGLPVSHFEDYVETHQVLIESPLIVERAIRTNPEILQLESAKPSSEDEDAVDVIIEEIDVKRTTGRLSSSPDNVLEVSFSGKLPEESRLILAAVIDSYRDFLDETYKNITDETATLMTQARDVLRKELRDKEEGYREFRLESPLLGRSSEGVDTNLESLASIQREISQLKLERAEVESDLLTLQRAIQEKEPFDALLVMATEIAQKSKQTDTKDDSRLNLDNQLFPLLLSERELAVDFGPDHPKLKMLRDRIQLARNFFARPTAAFAAFSGDHESAETLLSKSGSAAEAVEMHLDYLNQKLDYLKVAEDRLDELYKEEYDEARKIAAYDIKDEAFRKEIDQTQQLYDSIITRLQDAGLVTQSGGYEAKIIAPPELGEQVWPMAIIIFPVAGLLGIMSGLGLVYLVDMADTSFRTSQEIQRRLGLPIVGLIPFIAAPKTKGSGEDAQIDAAIDMTLCAHLRPRSVHAEAYRGLRTALYFSMNAHNQNVVQVTSPNAGDGKSTTASNLAITFAQLGRKTLLIDADLRKPRVHRLFNLSGKKGLVSVIRDGADLDDVIHDTGIDGLSVIPCGPLPENPAELLTSPHFEELVEGVREKFDFVVIDTPPVLAVSDPSVVAVRVDGVLLVLRLSKSGRHPAERAKELLSRHGVNVIGVVVNNSDRGTRYGYGGYGYAYSYGNEKYLDESPLSSDSQDAT